MAAFTAGFFMACTVSPFDMVRVFFLSFVFSLSGDAVWSMNPAQLEHILTFCFYSATTRRLYLRCARV